MGGIINRPITGWDFRIKGKFEYSNASLNQSIPGKDKLMCFYINARSIVYKMSELELYILEEKPDIIGITESWTYEDLQNSELNFEGYTLLRKDRIVGDKIRGGGVMLYISNTLNATVREDLIEDNFPECIWCDVIIENEITLIGICYRCPSSNKLNDEALFRLISKSSIGNIMLMGDFNFSELDWRKPETLDDSHPFLKCINDNFLIQHVDEPTRKNNILDLVFTSEENMIENLSVGEHFGTSDHQIIR